MRRIEQHQWIGLDAHQPKAVRLQAGRLEAELLDGRLKNITWQGVRVVDEVYFALRDANWGTIPYEISGQKVQQSREGFEAAFRAVHRQGAFQFTWDCTVEGSSDGALRFEACGTAQGSFLSNRIGFCVLHPLACAGLPCDIRHAHGGVEHTAFPLMIAPHQPFMDIAGMSYELEGVGCAIAFEGDVFECEDQRNWTDASFKTYCTPLALPFPVQVDAGVAVSQAVAIRCGGRQTASMPADQAASDELDYASLAAGGGALSLGSCLTDLLGPLDMETAVALALPHVRLDLHMAEMPQGWMRTLQQAAEVAGQIHLAVFLTEDWQDELVHLDQMLQEHPRIAVLLLHQEGRAVIDPQMLQAGRDRLRRSGLRIGSGTDGYFTQLNREPLPADAADIICYSNNPQVHAFDTVSMMATCEGQEANVNSAAHLYPGMPIHVTPITLKPRWNPDATSAAGSKDEQLLRQIDARQMSLFGGAWLLRSIISLCRSGAESACYFELSGPRGLFAHHQGTLPGAFPAHPGSLYPAYHVMRSVIRMLAGQRSRMHNAAGFSVMTDGRNILIANTMPVDQSLVFRGWPDFTAQVLDAGSAEVFAQGTEAIAGLAGVKVTGEPKTVQLAPYALVFGRIPTKQRR